MVGVTTCLRGIGLLATAVMAREMAMAENNAQISKEMYESGQVHESLMAAKMVGHYSPLLRHHAMLTVKRNHGREPKQRVS